jgi:hypothetical protein
MKVVISKEAYSANLFSSQLTVDLGTQYFATENKQQACPASCNSRGLSLPGISFNSIDLYPFIPFCHEEKQRGCPIHQR